MTVRPNGKEGVVKLNEQSMHYIGRKGWQICKLT